MRPDGHGDRQHGRHGDGDAADEQHEEIVDAVPITPALNRVHDDDLGQHPHGDGADAEVPDGRENLLEVAHLVGAVDQVCSLSEESVDAGGDDDGLDLALLAGGAGEDLVVGVLGDGKGLAGESGLVDLQSVAFEETGVGGDDVTELDADDVAGDENGGFLLAPFAVSEDLGFGSEAGHEGGGGVAGVVLFDETDGGVDYEQADDADEVLPVGGLALAVGEDDCHQSSSFHNPRQRVPHETKKLEEFPFLLLFQFVGAEDLNPRASFLRTQPLAAAFQLLENFLYWNLFLQGNSIQTHPKS